MHHAAALPSRGISTVALLSALVCLPVSTARAQVMRWMPTEDGNPLPSNKCGPGSKFTVSLSRVMVTRTANDAGSHEEWDISFPNPLVVFRISPRDHTEDDQAFDVNRKLNISTDVEEFTIGVGGQESDAWPNDDDPIPKFSVLVFSPCSPPPTTPTQNGVMPFRCFTVGTARGACYVFHATFP